MMCTVFFFFFFHLHVAELRESLLVIHFSVHRVRSALVLAIIFLK